MPSLYLQAGDYCLYGLSDSTRPEEVIRASTLINAFCHRPEGLISSDGIVMDASGEAIVEEMGVPPRFRVTLSRVPVVTLTKLESSSGQPHVWTEHTIGEYGYLNSATGFIELPPRTAYPGRLRVTYVAGWTYDALPDAVKLAASLLVKRVQSGDDLGPNVKRAKAGDAALEWFDSRVVDDEVASLLHQYRRVVL